MNTPAPIALRYDGETFVPASPRFAAIADKLYAVDETVVFVPHEERSAATHRHYFAAVHDAWLSLGEQYADRFPTSEALRKYALVRAGYADHRSIVCSSKAEALRIAAFVKPMDTFAVVTVSGPVVNVYTPQSQSTKAMDRRTFAESKQKVLDILADLIGVEPTTLAQNAGRAA